MALQVARRSATCWLNKAETIHIGLWGRVRESLQPGPSQGCIWFSGFWLQIWLTSTALHTRQRPRMRDYKELIEWPLVLAACWGHPRVRHWCTHTESPAWRTARDSLPYTSLIRSLFIVPYEIKNERNEENEQTDGETTGMWFKGQSKRDSKSLPPLPPRIIRLPFGRKFIFIGYNPWVRIRNDIQPILIIRRFCVCKFAYWLNLYL